MVDVGDGDGVDIECCCWFTTLVVAAGNQLMETGESTLCRYGYWTFEGDGCV